MNKKKLNPDSVVNELTGQSSYFREAAARAPKKEAPQVDADVPEDTQKATQMSKRLSKRSSRSLLRNLSNPPSTEEVEEMAFRLRKETKTRINADIPEGWKKRLDDLAHDLQVGKYDMVTYVIAQFLEEV